MQKPVYEFISKKTGDPIIEWETCAVSGKSFPIYQSDKEFYEKISPTFGGKKYLIPFPTLCPEERQRRRFMRRNERKLYHRRSDLSGKQIIALYPPESDYLVYSFDEWRSDNWDPLAYGRIFDFSRSFFQQFNDLYKVVPKIALNGHVSNENCPYVNYIVQSKDCYLCFAGGQNEKVYYGWTTVRCQYCVDCYFSFNCEQSYNIFGCDQCQYVYNASYCRGCHHGYFLEDCDGCSYCFACIGLKNQSYYAFNKSLSPEEYNNLVARYRQGDQGLIQKIQDFYGATPHRALNISQSEYILGNNITNAENCRYCFNIEDAKDMKYCDCIMLMTEDMHDCDQGGIHLRLCYETLTLSMNIHHAMFCMIIRDNCTNLFYCADMSHSSDCFACVGLKNKQYCIFNKQYTKEEYEVLVPKIITKMQEDGERGEFFDPSGSPFAYNETIAQEFYPLDKVQATAKGWKWKDEEYNINIPGDLKTIKVENLAWDIDDVDDTILEQAIICEASGKPFKIIPQELAFYREHGIPLSRRHPDQRYLDIVQKRNHKQLFSRLCDKCHIEIQSIYDPQMKEIVYCEKCYQKEMYG